MILGCEFCGGSLDAIIVASAVAAWALLLVGACLHRPIVRVFIIALNTAVIAATITTGWHYVTDVVAGIVVCIIICLVTKPSEIHLCNSTP